MKREHILSVARALLQEKGTTFHISELAKRAETSVGTVYNHLESKEKILATLLEEDLETAGGPADVLDVLMKYVPKELADVVRKRLE